VRSLYILNVTIHVLAAFVWLGGMLFLAVVGAPVLRRLESQELRSQLFREIGEQFRWVGWASIGIMIVTGVLNLSFAGVLHAEVLFAADFWTTPYGRTLGGKLGAVAVMIVIAAVHDFILGPRATRMTPGSPEALAFRRRAGLLARVNAVLGVIVVWAAVLLARGG
jgi:putative copper resistance protein D